MNLRKKARATNIINNRQRQDVIDEHSVTINMLNTIRESKRSASMVNTSYLAEGNDRDNKELILVNDGEVNPNADKSIVTFYETDVKEFMDFMGDPSIIIDKFYLTPKSPGDSGNAKMTGKLGNGIIFDMNKIPQLGLIINANNIKLDKSVVEELGNLLRFKDKWAGDWGRRLNNEI